MTEFATLKEKPQRAT